MRWIVAAVCVLVAVALAFVSLRSVPGSFNWADAGCTVANAPGPDTRGPDTVVCFPKAEAGSSDYRKTAQETCERWGVRPLGAYLEVRLRGPRPVARKYVRWMRAPGGRLSRTTDETKLRAVYHGCLQGFRDRA